MGALHNVLYYFFNLSLEWNFGMVVMMRDRVRAIKPNRVKCNINEHKKAEIKRKAQQYVVDQMNFWQKFIAMECVLCVCVEWLVANDHQGITLAWWLQIGWCWIILWLSMSLTIEGIRQTTHKNNIEISWLFASPLPHVLFIETTAVLVNIFRVIQLNFIIPRPMRLSIIQQHIENWIQTSASQQNFTERHKYLLNFTS